MYEGRFSLSNLYIKWRITLKIDVEEKFPKKGCGKWKKSVARDKPTLKRGRVKSPHNFLCMMSVWVQLMVKNSPKNRKIAHKTDLIKLISNKYVHALPQQKNKYYSFAWNIFVYRREGLDLTHL